MRLKLSSYPIVLILSSRLVKLCAFLGYRECKISLLLATHYSTVRYFSKFDSVQELPWFSAGRECINPEVLTREIVSFVVL